MRIIKQIIDYKEKVFSVKMVIEENTDDCWNIFNLMSQGDFVLGTCTRKVQKYTLTGLVKNEKKRINVLVKVKVSLKLKME